MKQQTKEYILKEFERKSKITHKGKRVFSNEYIIKSFENELKVNKNLIIELLKNKM